MQAPTFIKQTYQDKNWHKYALYECHCGNEFETRMNSVKCGDTKTCGCYISSEAKKLTVIKTFTTHGMSHTKEFKTWSAMKKRCGVVGTSYENVTYCEEWKTFESFYSDMGEIPVNTSLDRIDSHGNYEKENCRWAGWDTQCNNKKETIFLTNNGLKLSVAQWTRKLGLSRTTIYDRIRRGVTGKSLFLPTQAKGINQYTSKL